MRSTRRCSEVRWRRRAGFSGEQSTPPSHSPAAPSWLLFPFFLRLAALVASLVRCRQVGEGGYAGVHSITISQISNLRDINSFPPGITRNPPFHSSITSGTMVVEQPEVAALPPPSPPHSHPHQPVVPPPPPQNATIMEAYANNPLVDAHNLQRQVENGLREETGGNIDPDMVDAVIQVFQASRSKTELEGWK
nr:E3 ubiquitin-protein ligase RNF12-like [Ipomoea batatas]